MVANKNLLRITYDHIYRPISILCLLKKGWSFPFYPLRFFLGA